VGGVSGFFKRGRFKGRVLRGHYGGWLGGMGVSFEWFGLCFAFGELPAASLVFW